jgi:NADP-dependent 3-hydroxy acid dehydrogenase YdfG
MIRIVVGSQQVQISGSTVLLTGATGGLGHAIARAMRDQGAGLILTGRRAEVLEPLADELGARALAADLSRPEEVTRLAAEAGDADILVANAGLPGAARLERFTTEEVDRVLDVNLRAPIALTHALLPGMLDRGRGHIVFISSTGGKAAAPGNPLYHATKFGLRGFSGGLRIDLHGSGVGVSCVLPGFISEAGLFAESGAKLPFGVGTRTPKDVGRAVIRVIERDRPEAEVTSPFLRIGSVLWGLAPDLASGIARRMGSEQIARTYEEAMRSKR